MVHGYPDTVLRRVQAIQSVSGARNARSSDSSVSSATVARACWSADDSQVQQAPGINGLPYKAIQSKL